MPGVSGVSGLSDDAEKRHSFISQCEYFAPHVSTNANTAVHRQPSLSFHRTSPLKVPPATRDGFTGWHCTHMRQLEVSIVSDGAVAA